MYLSQVGSYFKDDQNLLAPDPATYRQLFVSRGQNGDLLTDAEAFHNDLDDFNVNPPPVPYNILTADPRATTLEVREYPCWHSQNGLCVKQTKYRSGDGTVPWLSASLGGTNGSGNVSVCTFHQSDLGGKIEHGTLLSDSHVMSDVQRILNNQTPVNCHSLSLASTSAETASAPPPFLQIAVWGDVTASVQDNSGNLLGIVNNNAFNDIPLASYDVTDGGVSIVLPISSTYTITLKSTTSQSVLVSVTDFRAPNQNETFTSYESAVFVDAPMVVSGTAQLPLDYNAGLSNLQLQLYDDQGLPTSALPPTSVLDQQQVQDITPPTTTIAVQGTQTPSGFYTGPVTVTLSASDTGTGVLKTEYSMDKGLTWQNYSAPLNLVAEQTPLILARSTDNGGNQEYPGVAQRLQPILIFLPLITR